MAQWQVETQALDPRISSHYEVMMSADSYSERSDGIGGNLVDAFGRVRISDPYTLFEASVRYGLTTERFSSQNSATGSTITMSTFEGCANIALDANSGSYIYRESKKVFGYQPGKSLLILNSFNFAPAQTNLRQRIGYFSANNGIYFEQANNEVTMVIRTIKTGQVTENRVPQSQWNVDKMDGTGPSRFVLDTSNTQIQFIDIEWLGAGTVRTGFIINGKFNTVHKFHHANQIKATYMQTACLPIRLEVENIGPVANASIFKQICHSVVSEGGYSQVTTTRSVSNPLAGKNLVGITPMVSIRLREGRTDAIVIPSFVSMYGLQATAYKVSLLVDVTSLTGASWVTADTTSSVEYDISATAVTGGRIVYEDIFRGQDSIPPLNLTEMFNHTLQLTRNLGATTGNIFTIAIEPTTNNDDGIISLSWQEHIQ